MLGVLDIGASGLKAQRLRLDTIAQNIANATTTRDELGRPNPYQRRFVVLAPGRPEDPSRPGVRVKEIRHDTAPFPLRYDPGHPDANAEGYVRYPNVDLAVEFVNALEATRAYEANITLMETTKAMFTATLKLIA
ncbi:MAG: flagellar basal body rod protein FlgC [Tepidisphaerales bacterium]